MYTDNAFSKFVIEYKDAVVKENVGACFHYGTNEAMWVNGESDNQAKFALAEAGTIEASANQIDANAAEGKNMSTVRFFDYGTGNSITIVSAKVVK